jgi:hypothetical protein
MPENALCMLFTAEHAETAEDKKYNAFEISGASHQDCLFFSALSAISAVNLCFF